MSIQLFIFVLDVLTNAVYNLMYVLGNAEMNMN